MITTSTSPQIRTAANFRILQAPLIPGLPAIDNGTALLSNTSIVRPQELVAGLLHRGTKGVLASSSKVGKTCILLQLALSVSTGTRFLRWNTTQGRVLYLNFEILPAFIKDRLAVLMPRLGLTNTGALDFWNLRGKTANFEALIANIIKETEGKNYTLIILDPIYKTMTGKSENMSGGVGALCNQLERLCERTGAAVVFSHHYTKGNAKKKAVIDRMSGSGVFARDADTIIALTEHTEPECYTVEMILRNLPKQPAFTVEFQYPVMIEREDIDPEDIEAEQNDTDDDDHGLLAMLDNQPLSSGAWEVAAIQSGMSRATFYRVKRALKVNDYIHFNRVSKTWNRVIVPVVKTRPATRSIAALPDAGTNAGDARNFNDL